MLLLIFKEKPEKSSCCPSFSPYCICKNNPNKVLIKKQNLGAFNCTENQFSFCICKIKRRCLWEYLYRWLFDWHLQINCSWSKYSGVKFTRLNSKWKKQAKLDTCYIMILKIYLFEPEVLPALGTTFA